MSPWYIIVKKLIAAPACIEPSAVLLKLLGFGSYGMDLARTGPFVTTLPLILKRWLESFNRYVQVGSVTPPEAIHSKIGAPSAVVLPSMLPPTLKLVSCEQAK